ncbi:MAG: AEC family transporter [Candidatus Limivicinus sp.]|jgi:predicted permease
MIISRLLSKMFVFLVLMLIGYAGARKKFFGPDFAKSASKLVINVFLTASILSSVVGKKPDISNSQLMKILLLMALIVVISYILALITVRLFKLGGENSPVAVLLISVMNNMFVGLPIVQDLYGPTAVLYIMVSNIPFNIILYTFGAWLLKRGRGNGEKSSFRFKDILSAPLIAALAAFLLFLTDIPIPGFIQELIGSLAGATMPMSMIVIGATLGPINILDAFRDKKVYIICFVRLILCPVLIWFIMRFFTNDPTLLATSVVIAGCPSAVIVSVFALQYDYDAVYSSKGVLATTTLSLVTMPLIISILL